MTHKHSGSITITLIYIFLTPFVLLFSTTIFETLYCQLNSIDIFKLLHTMMQIEIHTCTHTPDRHPRLRSLTHINTRTQTRTQIYTRRYIRTMRHASDFLNITLIRFYLYNWIYGKKRSFVSFLEQRKNLNISIIICWNTHNLYYLREKQYSHVIYNGKKAAKKQKQSK